MESPDSWPLQRAGRAGEQIRVAGAWIADRHGRTLAYVHSWAVDLYLAIVHASNTELAGTRDVPSNGSALAVPERAMSCCERSVWSCSRPQVQSPSHADRDRRQR